MLTAFAILWIISVWLLLLLALGFAATMPLMRRREPDPPDHPRVYGISCEDVTFTSRDGLQLGGWWLPAESARGTVIMCPGQNGSMDKDVPQALPLHRAGFNVLMFDYRAHGRSEGETVTIGALEQADLFGALDYLAAEHNITRVGVLGLSMGAGVALMVAAQDTRIAALVVDGAYSSITRLLSGYLRAKGFPGLLARGGAWLMLIAGSLRMGYQIYRANPADLVARITSPTLFIHGDQDTFVSSSEVAMLRDAIDALTDLWRLADSGQREVFRHHPED